MCIRDRIINFLGKLVDPETDLDTDVDLPQGLQSQKREMLADKLGGYKIVGYPGAPSFCPIVGMHDALLQDYWAHAWGLMLKQQWLQQWGWAL